MVRWNGQLLSQRHITGLATLERLCCTQHNRSITISPRRYRDRETGEWKDAGSYRPSDLPALIFALTKAQEYCYTTPLPGQEQNGEGGEDIPY